MFDLIYKGPTACMYPFMECNGNFFALNNILQWTYLRVTASICCGQMLSRIVFWRSRWGAKRSTM